MKFDFQFLNWILSIFKKKDTSGEVILSDPNDSILNESNNRNKVLRSLAAKTDLQAPMEKMIKFWDSYRPNSGARYWAIFDVTQHSRNKRLYIFDIVKGSVARYYCAHGKGSDPKFTGIAEKFSNVSGSLCTSLGMYKCAETYISGKFGYALRLDGLEYTNSNARKRAVVFHGAKYAEDAYVKSMGKTGRSEGCMAVGFQYSKDLIDKLKDGSPMIVWG